MTEIRWRLLAAERFRTGVLLAFALSAVFLALVGIFGVVSYSVVERHREIGVRMALGANRVQVVRLLLRQAMWPATLGLVIGVLASMGLSRLLAGFLYEIEPGDPLTLAGAATCLLVVALTAGFIPAVRGTRIEPMTSLRHE